MYKQVLERIFDDIFIENTGFTVVLHILLIIRLGKDFDKFIIIPLYVIRNSPISLILRLGKDFDEFINNVFILIHPIPH